VLIGKLVQIIVFHQQGWTIGGSGLITRGLQNEIPSR